MISIKGRRNFQFSYSLPDFFGQEIRNEKIYSIGYLVSNPPYITPLKQNPANHFDFSQRGTSHELGFADFC